MLSLRTLFLIIAIICIALTVIGGLMYPMNTMSIFEVSAYVLTVSLGIIGLLFLLHQRGFDESL